MSIAFLHLLVQNREHVQSVYSNNISKMEKLF
jgi:hypothetical protein